jgi:hypothetical protein
MSALDNLKIIIVLLTEWGYVFSLHYAQKRIGSRGSSVSIVSDYGLDDRAIGVRSPAEEKCFFFL